MNSKSITSLADLTALLELTRVRVYEVSARRRDGFDMEEIPVDPDESDLYVQQVVTDEAFIFRARIELCTDKAVIRADVAAIFDIPEPIAEPSESILDDFAQKVGLPLTLPYLRVYV